jgi:hypothetical protein
VTGRLQVALTEGVDIAARMLRPQLQKVEGISEEDMKLIKEAKKEAARKKQVTNSEEKKGTNTARLRP